MKRREFLLTASLVTVLSALPATYYLASGTRCLRQKWLAVYNKDLAAGFDLRNIQPDDLLSFYSREDDPGVWGRLFESLLKPNERLMYGESERPFEAPGYFHDPDLREITC